MIDKEDKLPVTRQCEILDLNRSGIYYKPVPLSAGEIELMRQIDEIHLLYPFYGSRNIRNELWSRGYPVGRDKVRRLMRRMGIEALYVKPKLSWMNPKHTKYPYLLRDLQITRANQVWCADITYIPMARGFCYLVAVMDWSSRMVLAWRLSNTLDSSFCVEALEEAITTYGCPEIFNTDQGSQFTAEVFTGTLQANNIAISMDGKGRWMDNVFIERLWKSVKYEDIYLKSYGSMTETRRGLSDYFKFDSLAQKQAAA
jgi:putative transposase